jgi:hypothetical protein
MPLTAKDRQRKRKQRRQRKLRNLKRRYVESKDARERQKLESKIRDIQPGWEPGAKS